MVPECAGLVSAGRPDDLFFLETPLPSDDLEGYARLADAAAGIPVAAGEWLTTSAAMSFAHPE